LDMRIGKHLVDTVDRAAWYSGRVEPADPVADRPLDEALLKDCIQRVTVLRSQLFRCKLRSFHHVPQLHRGADPPPHGFAAAGEVEYSIAGTKEAGRNAG